MGIRYKHEICDSWLQNEAKISEILPNLKKANFDAEFARKHEKEIMEKFQHQLTGIEPIKKKKKLFGWT